LQMRVDRVGAAAWVRLTQRNNFRLDSGARLSRAEQRR